MNREVSIVFAGHFEEVALLQQRFLQVLEKSAMPKNRLSKDNFSTCSLVELMDRSKAKKFPSVVLFEAPGAKDEAGVSGLKKICRSLREADPKICLILLCSRKPTGAEVMAWLDAGSSALLNRNFEKGDLSDALKEILDNRLNIQTDRSERVAAKHKIQVKLSSLEQALVAETLNVGTGGMFVRNFPSEAVEGDTVEFTFVMTPRLSDPLPQDVASNPWLSKMDTDFGGKHASGSGLNGTGLIVWLRHIPDSNGPEGMGVQFVSLSAELETLLSTFVKTHGVKAFVPKA